jgi:thymidylate synthase (FAD)
MDVPIVELQPGDLIWRNGFLQRVRRVESPTILTWPWIFGAPRELDPAGLEQCPDRTAGYAGGQAIGGFIVQPVFGSQPIQLAQSITIYHDPIVYLVGRQSIDQEALDAFLADAGVESWETDTDVAGQKLAEIAGRMCYMSFAKPRPGGNGEYLHHIIEQGHGQVLEAAVFNFILTGVSRSFTHELVRHRVGTSFAQLSQRYVNEGDCAFVEPDEIAQDPMLHESFTEFVAVIQNCYQTWAELLMGQVERKYPELSATERRKMARQTARACLPNCTETKIFLTMNARALRHFFTLRATRAADDEMRKVALAIHRAVSREAPNLFADFALVEDGGKQVLQSPHGDA